MKKELTEFRYLCQIRLCVCGISVIKMLVVTSISGTMSIIFQAFPKN